jgi:hypothetical protein
VPELLNLILGQALVTAPLRVRYESRIGKRIRMSAEPVIDLLYGTPPIHEFHAGAALFFAGRV